MNKAKTIKAVDFDGTLAVQMEPYNPKEAGPPIPATIKLVKQWIKKKEKIVIFTSRVNEVTHTQLEIRYARKLITAWCKKFLGKSFPITAVKHPDFEYWDNKAHRVETNTGRILSQRITQSVMSSTLSSAEKAKALKRGMNKVLAQGYRLPTKEYKGKVGKSFVYKSDWT